VVRRFAENAYLVLAVIFMIEVLVQFITAGLGVFGAESFSLHQDLGGLTHLSSLLLVLLAIWVRRNRVDLTLTIGLFVLVTIQLLLPDTRDDAPGLAGMHVLGALLIFVVTEHILRREIVARRARPAVAPEVPR
jgi:hypothetical protein